MAPKKAFVYRFDGDACKSCGARCCRGLTGYVWVGRREIEGMAAALKLDVDLFARRYLRQVQRRHSLRERVINGEHLCCFLEPVDGRCTIYEVRPEQCRRFPFWSEFRQAPQRLFLECPGVRQVDPRGL